MDADPKELRRTTFAHAPADKVFWVCRGDKVDNVRDLANCIESLTPAQFAHHVSIEGKKNDFAIWIHDVLRNPLLSRDLNYPVNLNNQQHYVKTLRDHLAWLETV